MTFLTNNSELLLERSMGFLWTKQAALLDNISNAETPNYKPKVVTFEEDLRSQLEAAMRSDTSKNRTTVRSVLENAQVTITEPQESTRMDDNGVNTTEQMVEVVRTAYQLQYVMQSITNNLSVLRSAIRGQ